MQNIEKTVVIIPVYKAVQDLKDYEKISISNTVKVLGANYSIYLIHPETLDINQYLFFFNYSFKNKSFDSKYFKDQIGYNTLCLSKHFYEAWSDFSHMMIIQSDAFIFRDEIKLFLKYDYIGAPWIKSPIRLKTPIDVYPVGNGGFSLRNISKVVEVFSSNKKLMDYDTLRRSIFMHHAKKQNEKKLSIFQKLVCLINSIYIFFFLNSFKKVYKLNYFFEDVLLGIMTGSKFKNFKVAPFEEAVKFAFECEPSKLYNMTNQRLPMGCHAFNCHETDFWKNHIPELK
jgi:hypothetical protein